MPITYRPATEKDLPAIADFCDYWLRYMSKHQGLKGAKDDYFIPHGRHASYLVRKIVWLALDGDTIIGWAVKDEHDCLLHLLVAKSYRNKGIGSTLFRILNPASVRSKSDQATGNPIDFYTKQGYELFASNQGKNKNIDILKKPGNSGESPQRGTPQKNRHDKNI